MEPGYRSSRKEELECRKRGRIDANGEDQTCVEHHAKYLVVEF